MDFFEYVNKSFIENNPIPSHQTSWGHFYIARENNYNQLLKYIKKPETYISQLEDKYHYHFNQMCNFYNSLQKSCNDSNQNLSYLVDFVNINMNDKNNSTIHNFLYVCSHLQKVGINVPIQTQNNIDFKCNKRYLLCIGDGSGGNGNNNIYKNTNCCTCNSQKTCLHQKFNCFHSSGGGGISLPDKSFYLDLNSNNNKILLEYKKFITSFDNDFCFTQEMANTICNIETDLAKIIIDNDKKLEPTEIYNIYTIKEFKKTFSNIPAELFTLLFLMDEKNEIWILYPNFLKNIHRVIWKYSKTQWSTFFKWKILLWICPYIHYDKYFNFYGKIVRGQLNSKSKDLIDLGNTLDYYGHIFGEIFRREMFDDNEQKRDLLNEMISNIKKSFKQRLEYNDWMTSETKKKAIKKLDNIKWKLGGIKLNDYFGSDLNKVIPNIKIDPNDLISNLIQCNLWIFEKMYWNHKKCIDDKEWFMYSFEVNAYYSPENNEMVFPAGILQKPFFDVDSSIEENYGSIGCIIGHELTHAFDNNGSKYNENGELYEWWKPSDKKKFEQKKKNFNKIFEKYSLYNIQLNTDLTCGENIADAGGIRISFNACLTQLNQKIVNPNKIKTFFTSYAKSFCVYRRKELEILLLKSDPHSPPKIRVNAILNNFKPFLFIFFGFMIKYMTKNKNTSHQFLYSDFLMNVSNDIEIW